MPRRCSRPSRRYSTRIPTLQRRLAGARRRRRSSASPREIGALLAHGRKYRCAECGFAARKFHWQCPACQSWDSFEAYATRKAALNSAMISHMTTKSVKTVVFPVAGRGTRFLPATKASPKEMLPIVDKPLIQYAVDEALSAGADTLVFITGSSKRAIEDHFDTDAELEAVLQAQGKQELLDTLHGILPSLGHLRVHPPARAARPGPRGAVRAAGGRRRAVHGASRRRSDRCPRALPEADGGRVRHPRRQRARRAERAEAGHRQVRHRVARDARWRRASARCPHIVEKPKPASAPSNLAVVGRTC